MTDNAAERHQETDTERAERLAAQADEGRRLHDTGELRSRTRRSVLTGVAAVAAGGLGWRALLNQEEDGNIPSALRSGFRVNEAVWSTIPTVSGAREFPMSARQDIRVNSTIGMEDEIDLDAWTLLVQDDAGETIDELDMEPILALDQVDMTTRHKCVEGWSAIAHWTGPRFSDFADRYDDAVTNTRYVSFMTPDAGYYVGFEMARAMHPQSLLAHSLNGEPLTQDHGAPLRFYTPNNYGIKSLKRLGLVQFTNTMPADYWAERGYDWYSEF